MWIQQIYAKKKNPVCLEKLENYLKQGYHLFFDDILNQKWMEDNFLTVNALVDLLSKYPKLTVWIAMRPDSYFKNPGFDEVKLKTNFRNSPKIIAGVNGFFDAMRIKPDSHEKRAESVFVSLDKLRVDGGSPKLVVGYCCESQNQSLELIRTALEAYKGDTVFLVQIHGSTSLLSSDKSRRIHKEILEQQNPEFAFVPLWKYNTDAKKTCFFHFSDRTEIMFHDIWNGIEVKNLIVFVGCNLHSHGFLDSVFDLLTYSYSYSYSYSIYIEILRSLMLRASVSLTVIICQAKVSFHHSFWQHRMKQCFNIIKLSDNVPQI
jgi:hypothetical protein